MAVERNSVVVEEYLQAIYGMQKTEPLVKAVQLAPHLNSSPSTVHATLSRMQRDGLIQIGTKKEIILTPAGFNRAEELAYRHQLVETFLCDHLGIPWHEVHQHAHILEHGLTPLVAERLAVFLKFPQHCPHGSPMPGGTPPDGMCFLSELAEDQKFEVVLVEETLEDSALLMQYLQAQKLVPGESLTVQQKVEATGTFVLTHQGTSFSLPIEVATKIGVLPLS